MSQIMFSRFFLIIVQIFVFFLCPSVLFPYLCSRSTMVNVFHSVGHRSIVQHLCMGIFYALTISVLAVAIP